MEIKLNQHAHRRFNPLSGEWVIVSPHRTNRPWQGAVEAAPSEDRPRYDPSCYLCPGNQRAGIAKNPNYESTFVFDNDFAALTREPSGLSFDLHGKGLLVAAEEQGICRVMCFSPRHDLNLATMNVGEIETVVRCWIDQSKQLFAVPGISYVQIFENRGAMMGASNPHPHCQIWATSSVPQAPARETQSQAEYLANKNSCLLCDYASLELDEKDRLIFCNDAFIAVVPFWALWPFEILVCSRRHFGSFAELTAEEISDLSQMLNQIVSSYDRVFNAPFPYSMGFHQAPSDGKAYPEWHFHAHFYPPLLRSATVRKFMVGFEMLGTAQRDITPELAAEKLRLVSREEK